MIAMEALKEVMRITEVKTSVLADRLGIKQNVLSERYKQRNVSVNKLSEMLRALDYKVVIVPRNTRIPDGGYEVE